MYVSLALSRAYTWYMPSYAIICFVCLIYFFTSDQQSFSYKGTGLPENNVPCSMTQRCDASEA